MTRRPIMNLQQIKEEVIKNCKEGQIISLVMKTGDTIKATPVKVKILTFYENHVLTEHNGYKESFTYREFLRMAAGVKGGGIKPDKLDMRERTKNGSRERKVTNR